MGFHCVECGAGYQKWVGKCNFCNSWNTIVENDAKDTVMRSIGKQLKIKTKNTKKEVNFASMEEISSNKTENRMLFSFDEINRVLGGGLMPSSAVLIGGEPGIGKSTLLLQLADDAFKKSVPVLYISGEESAFQIKDRASRIAKNCNISLLNVTDLHSILNAIKILENTNAVIIIDSIQTVYMEELGAGVGSIAQVRACSNEIITLAKKSGVSVFIIGHINKEGQIAGPKLLEHMVDVVLYFESDNTGEYRIVKSVKNRFGNVGEMAIFKMLSTGLAEVTNPSELFLSKEEISKIGICVACGIEGTRAMLLTVESLVVQSYAPMPRRNVVGYDANRLAMVLAVLSVNLKLKLYDQEIHLNIAGGMKNSEPALDLPVAFAIFSSFKQIPIPHGVAFIGEIGLSGEVRPVRFMEARIKEAKKLGFKRIICPVAEKGCIQIKTVGEITKILENLSL